ncbi:uncharacterized protein EI90DRAFT_3128234 [Cantharellus anzutake]|uniref:uncharacterized protein n=1 Tax=Cantharellus anzutake TaxID=1750568 RepID=UPI001903352F|nr:uncharacterized protein EI90DRAFT_3128234 [Cantharellus anzutake]KAF8326099.1 hypothetical protein EI90DRAFT_3128234 [Cantharellus anzutake]
MAAGNSPMLRTDPAIERWVSMRENVYQHFRFTPVKTRQVVGLMVIVPAFCGLLAYATDNKFDWAGKKKNDSLLRTPASSQD